MSGSKARYLNFCGKYDVPLHLQPWWLDAVCGPEGWEAAVAGTPVTGIWPWRRTRRWGIPVVQLPPLTAYGGPWFRPFGPDMPVSKRLAIEHRTWNQLIEQLPRVLFFHQTCRPEIQNVLPLHWGGFHQTTRYTYLLPDTSDLPALYAGLKNTLRTDLRRADERVDIVPETNPDVLFDLNRQSFFRKNLQQPYSRETFHRLHAALRLRDQSAGFVARDRRSGAAVAGLFLAFDTRQAAVLLTGLDRNYQDSGALHRLYWEAVCFCSAHRLSLDFEGSMNPGIERVFRRFGGQLTPYFRVWRYG